MSCEVYRDIVDKYVEGLATPDERTALEEHMKTCAECKSEVEDISRILRAFGSFESVDLPVDFMPLLHEKLLKVQAERRKTWKMAFFPDVIRNFTVSFHNFYRQNSRVLAAGLCIVLISFFLGRFSGMSIDHQAKTGTAIHQQMAQNESAAPSSKPTKSSAPAEEFLDEDKIQADINEGSEKKLMMAGSPAPGETKIKEGTQKDAAAIARSGDAEQSTALNKSSRDGSVKDMTYSKGEVQYKALQEGGPKAAAAIPPSQKEMQSEQVTLYVDDFDKKVVSAISLADQLGGDTQQSRITENGDNSRKAYIVMKVPVENLASALEQIQALGETEQDLEEPQVETTGEAKDMEAEKQMTMQTQVQEEQPDKNLSDEGAGDKATMGKGTAEKETTDIETEDKEITDREQNMGIIRINIIEKETIQKPSN